MWGRKFAIWSNVVKKKKTQDFEPMYGARGEIIFPLQHWKRRDALRTKEKLKLRQIFCSTEQTTKKYKKDP